jgi:hypothetical protein
MKDFLSGLLVPFLFTFMFFLGISIGTGLLGTALS